MDSDQMKKYKFLLCGSSTPVPRTGTLNAAFSASLRIQFQSGGVKKAPDPDPQHWLKAGLHIRTLLFFNFFQIRLNDQYFIGSGYETLLLSGPGEILKI